MTAQIIRIATRKSRLALWQAEYVAKLIRHACSGIKIELVKMSTRGDKILDAPLAKVGGKGLFVKELEQGILEGWADIAVHSMKDVPVEFPQGLHLAAILPREDPCDALVSNKYAALNDLPADARVGTSSLRRQCQIKERFPDVEVLALRGNVNTRLDKLDAGEYDAIILAAAGLKRLGLAGRITETLDTTVSLPAIGQGAIGIECRSGDRNTNQIVGALHDLETSLCVTAERAMNERLHGGCQVPIGGYAELKGDSLLLRGLVGRPDGMMIFRAEAMANRNEAKHLGYSVADELLLKGADQILQELYH